MTKQIFDIYKNINIYLTYIIHNNIYYFFKYWYQFIISIFKYLENLECFEIKNCFFKFITF